MGRRSAMQLRMGTKRREDDANNVERSGLADALRMMAAIATVMLAFAAPASSHGRLVDPPSRSSMWRYGYQSVPNYTDMELFCGGFTRQWQKNDGKCGICGDAWDSPDPKPNEIGGQYLAKGSFIVRTYSTSDIVAKVELTANHKGHFEFRVCPYDTVDPTTEVTQECLDSHQLELQDGSGTKFQLPANSGVQTFEVPLRLPSNVSCERCLFQWIYKSGNNWGKCDDGKSRLGCGPQEEFRGCADVKIVAQLSMADTNVAPTVDDTVVPTQSSSGITGNAVPEERISFLKGVLPALGAAAGAAAGVAAAVALPGLSPAVSTVASVIKSALPGHSAPAPAPAPAPAASPANPSNVKSCTGAGMWAGMPEMAGWCMDNCNHVPSFCPPSHCVC